MMIFELLITLMLSAEPVACRDRFGFSELLPPVLTKNTPNFLGYVSDDDKAPAHISLHAADNCSLPVVLTSGATDGGYLWTPHGGFPTGKEFELELNQGGRVKRSKRFVLQERQIISASSSGFGAFSTPNPSAADPLTSTTPSTAAAAPTQTGNSDSTVQNSGPDDPDGQQPDSGSSDTTSNANGANTNTNNNNSNNSSSSLSTGAAIGIGIAVGVVVIGALAAVALWWFRRYKRKHQLYGPRGDRVEVGELQGYDHRHEMAENVARGELATNANRHELAGRGGSRKKGGLERSELAAD